MAMTREDAPVVRNLGRAGTWLLMLLVCGAAGCGNHSNAGALPPPVASAPRATVAPAAARTPDGAVQVTPTIKLYGTLSPEELEACYNTPQITNVGLARPAAPASAPSYAAAEIPLPAAGAGWDVRLGRNWRHIVIHHSATATGSAASFDREHRERGWEGLGYHFVIGNGTGTGDGQVEVGYRWRNQQRGAHAGNLEYNEYGIGICLVGDFETGYATARQMASLRALVRFLQAKCGIATASIIGHSDVPGKDTRCPGRNFSVAAFRAGLSGELASAPPVAPLAAPRARATPAAASRNVLVSSGGALCP
jgi:N-acetylmuramoyl-L-alanine amidase